MSGIGAKKMNFTFITALGKHGPRREGPRAGAANIWKTSRQSGKSKHRISDEKNLASSQRLRWVEANPVIPFPNDAVEGQNRMTNVNKEGRH